MSAPETIWIGEDVKFYDEDGAHITHDPEATHLEYHRADTCITLEAHRKAVADALAAQQASAAVGEP